MMETGLGQVDKARVRKAFQEKFDLLMSSLEVPDEAPRLLEAASRPRRFSRA